MSEPRIGVVAYSNVAPLVDGLSPSTLRRGVPARVVDWLRGGEVDVALVPAVELGRAPALRALPGLGVAADGQCLSVLLFGRVPLGEIQTVTLDAASRSAATLTRILLDREGASVQYRTVEGGSVGQRLVDSDATLLIGDPALEAEVPVGVTVWDLATEWKRHVGLPFVFAVWATRSDVGPSPELWQRLAGAAERGLARRSELAAEQARLTGLSASLLERYLNLLQYRLGKEHLRGLRAFLDEAHRIGVLEEGSVARFWPEPT